MIALTTTVMAVIFAELLFVPALIQNATDRVEQELRTSLTGNVSIRPTGSATTISDVSGLLDQVRAIPTVAAATAVTLAGSQVSSGNRNGSWSVFAVDPDSYRATFVTPRDLIEGRFLDPTDVDSIVLGIGIAGADRTNKATYGNSLESVHVGDDITITLVDGQTHRFRVKGIYDDHFDQANSRGFISASGADRLLPQLQQTANSVFIKTAHVGDEAGVISRVRRGRPDLSYQSWQALASTVREITGSFDVIRSILSGVSLVVAAVTVFIVTYVDLVSRRRTIGIERAIGIKAGAIVASYLLKGALLAVVGVVFGAILFRLGVVPVVNTFPFQFPIGPVTLTVTSPEMIHDAVILVIVAEIGALIPALRAVRVRLLDAIWS